jgi:hypothetical protein
VQDEIKEEIQKSVKVIIIGVVALLLLVFINKLMIKNYIILYDENREFSIKLNKEYTTVYPKGYIYEHADIEFINKMKTKFGFVELMNYSNGLDYSGANQNRYLYYCAHVLTYYYVNVDPSTEIKEQNIKIKDRDYKVFSYYLNINNIDCYRKVYLLEIDDNFIHLSLTGLKENEKKLEKEFDNIAKSITKVKK